MQKQDMKKQLQEEFCQLIKFDSPSWGEREIADCLKAKLEELGCQVQEDAAGRMGHGTAGNIYAYLPGTMAGEPILLSAHLDTVEPSKGKAVRQEGDKLVSAGQAVLGADCVTGLVEILQGIRLVQASGRPYPPVEIVLPVAEETYCEGSSLMDFSKVQARTSYVLDLTGPVGTAANQAPSLVSFRLTIRGRAAHSGMEPEKGIHAISLMAKVLGRLPQGHVDELTTCNVGLIEGGQMINIVPEQCTIKGEVRGFDHDLVMAAIDRLQAEIKECLQDTGAVWKFDYKVHIHCYLTRPEAQAVKRFQAACRMLGLPGTLTKTFGGSDQNVFSQHGLEGLVLSNGMYKMHTVEEYTTLEDLWQGSRLVAQLILGGEAL